MLSVKPSRIAQSFQKGIFSELADYKKLKLQQGASMIDLSIGSPDISPPQFVMDALRENVQDRQQYGYTLTGTDRFHEAVQHYYYSTYGVKLDKNDEILQLMGSQDGLVHMPMTVVEPGEMILVPDPGYPAYDAGVKMAQAETYSMPLEKNNHFLPDLTKIPEKIAQQAKMMILNFPGNPVPALADHTFFKEVVEFAKKYHIFVVHDFAYSELVFDKGKAVSFLEVEGAKDVGVEFHSLSKSFNLAGCRIGYVVGHKGLVAQLRKLKSNLDYGVFSPIQQAGTEALRYGQKFLEENLSIYENRRNILVNGLREIGWDVDKPKASMFMWSEIPKGYTSQSFIYELMDQAGVVVTPGHAFGKFGEGYVRIALVQNEEFLQEAVNRIKDSGIIDKV